ncbi:MAG: hypothetical protein U0S48_19880 [Solirubrobacteraceae bacterium]
MKSPISESLSSTMLAPGVGVVAALHEQVEVVVDVALMQPDHRESVPQVVVAGAPVQAGVEVPQMRVAVGTVAEVVARSPRHRTVAHAVGDARRQRTASRRRAPQAREAPDAPSFDRHLGAREEVVVRVVGAGDADVEHLRAGLQREAQHLAGIHPRAVPRRLDDDAGDRREVRATGDEALVVLAREGILGAGQHRRAGHERDTS